MFGFLKAFAEQKGEDTLQGIAETMATLDPETASKAQVREIEQRLDKATMEVATARREFQKENQEAVDARATYNDNIADAEYLQTEINEGRNVEENQEALDELLAEMERLKPEVEREIQEAEEAREFLEETEALAQTIATDLKEIKAVVEGAKRDMQLAEKKQERMQRQQERQNRLKGLSGSSTAFAVNAMQKKADKIKDEMSALETKNKLMGVGKSKKTSSALEAARAARGAGKPKASLDSLRL